MKKLIYILIAVLVLASCEKSLRVIDTYSLREDSLLSQITDSLILPDSSWRKYLLVSPPLFPEDFTTQELLNERDSLMQIWDAACLFMAFGDTLLKFSRVYDLERRTDTLLYFTRNFEDLDSSFYVLFKKCINDTTLKQRKISEGLFKTSYNYKLIPDDSVKIITKMGFRVVEVNLLTRVIFNDSFDMACLGQLSICGGECGGGYLLFLKKRDGKWRIVKRHLLFVA